MRINISTVLSLPAFIPPAFLRIVPLVALVVVLGQSVELAAPVVFAGMGTVALASLDRPALHLAILASAVPSRDLPVAVGLVSSFLRLSASRA